jgi:hypothetical protein
MFFVISEGSSVVAADVVRRKMRGGKEESEVKLLRAHPVEFCTKSLSLARDTHVRHLIYIEMAYGGAGHQHLSRIGLRPIILVIPGMGRDWSLRSTL